MIGVGYLGLIMNSAANYITSQSEKSLKKRLKADRKRRASYHPNADVMLKQPPKKVQKCLNGLIDEVESSMITANDKLVLCKLLLDHFEKGKNSVQKETKYAVRRDDEHTVLEQY